MTFELEPRRFFVTDQRAGLHARRRAPSAARTDAARAVRLAAADRGGGQGPRRRERQHHPAPRRRAEAARAAREPGRRPARRSSCTTRPTPPRLVRVAGVQRPVGGGGPAPLRRSADGRARRTSSPTTGRSGGGHGRAAARLDRQRGRPGQPRRCARFASQPLTGRAAAGSGPEVFDRRVRRAPPRRQLGPGASRPLPAARVRAPAPGASWTLPLHRQRHASRPPPPRPVPAPAAGRGPPAPPPAAWTTAEARSSRPCATRSSSSGRQRPYYDDGGRRRPRATPTTRGIDADAVAPHSSRALSELLERRPHADSPPYKPMQHVYPWVDLHPDGKLRSIYSGKAFTPEELIEPTPRSSAARTERLQEFVAARGGARPRRAARPSSTRWRRRCRSTASTSCRSPGSARRSRCAATCTTCSPASRAATASAATSRTSTSPTSRRRVRDACGQREAERLRADRRQGPGRPGDAVLPAALSRGRSATTARELSAERLDDRCSPGTTAIRSSEYERHRNYAIAELQGNRNPLIDHPEWARSDRLRRRLGVCRGRG